MRKEGNRMRTEEEIEKVLDTIYPDENNYPSMTYENGIEEALMWVIEDIPNEVFSFTPRNKRGK